MKPIDMHVHIVGIGTGGTGCSMRVGGWRWPLEELMFRHIGLSRRTLREDFDRIYVERLLQLLRESSLGSAVILAMEKAYRDDGTPLADSGYVYVPNAYVLALAKRHPEFLPAVSIHPARADALDELERCLAEGAVMLKLLPNFQNVNCNDRRYTRFWERMAEAGLPFLAHTGGEHTVPNHAPQYADPRNLELPLQCGVTVIAAHSATRSGFFDPDYLGVLREMMSRHPRLYGDNSAFNIPFRSKAFRPCRESPFVERMLHGSDFPVLIYAHWAWLRGLIDFKTFRRWQSHPNVLERDYQLKRAIGFPEEVFTRVAALLRTQPAAAPA